MNIGKRLLRWMAPQEEDLRQEMRHAMACAEAHTEDVERTIVRDGAAIRAAVKRKYPGIK